MEAYEAAKERGWVGVSDERLMEMPKQEPVAMVTGVYGGRFTYAPIKDSVIFPAGMALYSSPQQRKPLTLGQKQRLWSSVGNKLTLKDRVNSYGLAIEAAHGIKE